MTLAPQPRRRVLAEALLPEGPLHLGVLRWFAFDPMALDLKTMALAAIAALMAFRLHRSLIEVIVVMAVLGVAMRLAIG